MARSAFVDMRSTTENTLRTPAGTRLLISRARMIAESPGGMATQTGRSTRVSPVKAIVVIAEYLARHNQLAGTTLTEEELFAKDADGNFIHN